MKMKKDPMCIGNSNVLIRPEKNITMIDVNLLINST